MFPGLGRQDARRGGPAPFAKMTQAIAEIEMMAHGGSVLEIKRTQRQMGGGGKLKICPPHHRRHRDADHRPGRRPRSAEDRPRTRPAPRVLGMINNCAGGRTPWGTWLSCEENFNGYFCGELADEPSRGCRNYKRIGIPSRWYNWGDYFDRFDVGKEPNEANRFGWVVEIDPFDPTSMPVKRTALGRFKHEGAAGIVNKDGRVVIYLGDDERFDYVYKFVTDGPLRSERPRRQHGPARQRHAVRRPVQCGRHGRLAAAGPSARAPLTAANGFASQADVLIETRRAADLLGATKMDRPEDVEANPTTGKVYVMLTNNSQAQGRPGRRRQSARRQRLRPHHRDDRRRRRLTPPTGSLGNPGEMRRSLGRRGRRDLLDSDTAKNGWFGMPDNCAVDCAGPALDRHRRQRSQGDRPHRRPVGRGNRGRGARDLEAVLPRAASAPKCAARGSRRTTRPLFLAVQHPGETARRAIPCRARPASRTGRPAGRISRTGMPPRPSVVAITKQGGGKIGV